MKVLLNYIYMRGKTPPITCLFGIILGALAGCADIPLPDPAVGYIAFGDSSAAGPAERDYPDILREMLGESPEAFANQAKSGESADEGLERLHCFYPWIFIQTPTPYCIGKEREA